MFVPPGMDWNMQLFYYDYLASELMSQWNRDTLISFVSFFGHFFLYIICSNIQQPA